MPNISKLSLAALRDQINAGTREVTFKTDDGALTQMVYIPKFRIPAGIWDNGQFPPQDLLLGGFFVDKYQCSHKNATSTSRGIGANPTITAGSTTDVAVSLPGKVPWTEITLDNAKKACENRKINGVSCHLMTMKEWATLAFLIRLLGHDVRGNNYYGRDIRDPNSFEYYGVPDVSIGGTPGSSGYPYYGNQVARVLTGTGPISWSHNGMANGVFDLVGNVWEFIDFTIDTGIYTAKKTAVIQDADGITATDTAIVIANVQNPELWPATDGLVLIKAEGTNTDEYVRYSNFVNNGNGTYTLTGCQRGQEGTTAGPHGNGAQVIQMTDYCLIPGGYSAVIADSGLNNTTNPATFTYSKLVLGPGKTGPAVGDVLQVENEQMTVTAVNGNQLTVNRGANGSTIAAHAQGVKFACISPQMSNNDAASTDTNYGAWQFGKFLTMRTELELAALALPATVNSSGNEEWKDGFWARWKGQRVALRGGTWFIGAIARAAFALNLGDPVGGWRGYIGFRAALSL
jgi:formylglycine-generating enzyme required for sulfatase activity